MDVWSLFATLIDVHPGMDFPPPPSEIYNDVLNAIQTAARNAPQLANMVRKDPRERASAAQMLVALFDGHGLTTLMSEVPPLTTAPIPVPATAPVPAAIRKPTPAIPHAGPSKSPTAKVDKVPAEVLPAKKDLPLIQYPRSPRKRQGGLPKLARAGGAAASPERMFDFDNPGMRGGMAARGSVTKPAMLASPA